MSSHRKQSLSTQPRHSTHTPRQQNFPFNYMACLLGHVTHAFLACDVRSSCWSKFNDDGIRQVWGFPWRGLCESDRKYPLAFTCADGSSHVPYTLVCDHRDDCHDGSDETFCTFPACRGHRSLRCGSSLQVEGAREREGRSCHS